jgi:hypothetical protein
MTNFNPEFIKTSKDVIATNGLDNIKRWAQSSDPTAEMFKKALEAARE